MPYDLIVIGSGPGGYSAAVRAGQYGLKTAIIEKQPKLGGTCLHVGCIPTKALLHTADVWEHFVHADEEGIVCENPRLDYPKVNDRKDGIVTKHAKGVEILMKKNKVEWIKGFATLQGRRQSRGHAETGTQTIEAKNIIIATGSEARMLPGLKPDPEFILTNIEILNLTAVPKTLAIIGAGAVGVEFASIFQRFGTNVTVLEMLPRVVPVEDEEVSKELERVFKKQGIRVETGAKAENIRKTGKGVKLTVTLANGKKEELEAEKLLVAVGRKPNTENIGLENTKVRARSRLHQGGSVSADRRARRLRHRRRGGRHAATGARGDRGRHGRGGHMAGKPADPDQPESHPGRTYTEPGIGSVGMTEAQAQAQGYKVKVGKFPFIGNSKATILGHHDGFVKVVADEQVRRNSGRPYHRSRSVRIDRAKPSLRWKRRLP